MLFGLAVAVGLTGGRAVAEESHLFEVVDSDAIYLGESEHPRTPAVIVADDVWAEIPEYKRIVDEELTDEDPEYHLLLKKATERFVKALKKVAKRDGYDLIGEVGSVEAVGDEPREIPDITADLIDIVTRD